jgi:glycosyltransferase involved in cell wall biosynthesis
MNVISPTYSLIVCSYNPDLRVLKRCLDAIKKITNKNKAEIILVDNNSTPPLYNAPEVKDFLDNCPDSILVQQPTPGLIFARIAGAEAASGDILVFFDDDNEPGDTYLTQLQLLNQHYENVGAWGPGTVTVDFIDGVRPDLDGYLRPLFQEKHQKFTEFAMLRGWQPCYPFGTGLSVKKTVFDQYVTRINKNEFTLTGRKGESLASGEDTQLVLFCIALGLAAGTSPYLRVNHLTPAKKLRSDYLRKLVHGTSSCYHDCHAQVFPEYRSQGLIQESERKKIRRKILRRYIKLKFRYSFPKALNILHELSALIAIYEFEGKPVPESMRRVYNGLCKGRIEDFSKPLN